MLVQENLVGAADLSKLLLESTDAGRDLVELIVLGFVFVEGLDDVAVGLAEVAAQVGDHGSDLSEIAAGLGESEGVAGLGGLIVGPG